eukprot:gene11727-biopygen6612
MCACWPRLPDVPMRLLTLRSSHFRFYEPAHEAPAIYRVVPKVVPTIVPSRHISSCRRSSRPMRQLASSCTRAYVDNYLFLTSFRDAPPGSINYCVPLAYPVTHQYHLPATWR